MKIEIVDAYNGPERKIVPPKEEDRRVSYESRTGKEFIDVNNPNHVFWQEANTGIIYPQKTYNIETNNVGSPELIEHFEDFNVVKSMQSSCDSGQVKTLEGDVTINIDNIYEMVSYWMIGNQTLSGEPLTNTLKMATLFKMEHKHILRQMTRILNKQNKVLKVDHIKNENVIEARYVNRFYDDINKYKRRRYFILTKEFTLLMINQMPKNDFNLAVSTVMFDLFNKYQDNINKQNKANEENLPKCNETESELRLKKALEFHYKEKHGKDIKVPYEEMNMMLYVTIGLPKRFRNGCKDYFTPEFRNYLSIMQDNITAMIEKSKVPIDLGDYNLVAMLFKDVREASYRLLPHITDTNTETLDRLMEAGIIKRRKPKGKGLSQSL